MINGKKEFPSTTIYYSIGDSMMGPTPQVVFIYGYTNITDPGVTVYYNKTLSFYGGKANLYASGEMVYIDINVTVDFFKQELKFEGTVSYGGTPQPVNDVVKF